MILNAVGVPVKRPVFTDWMIRKVRGNDKWLCVSENVLNPRFLCGWVELSLGNSDFDKGVQQPCG